MRFAKVTVNTNGRKKTMRLELLSSKQMAGPSGETILVVSGYKVNKEGAYIGNPDVEDIQVIVGAESIKELEIDWKYGELVPSETATQHNQGK